LSAGPAVDEHSVAVISIHFQRRKRHRGAQQARFVSLSSRILVRKIAFEACQHRHQEIDVRTVLSGSSDMRIIMETLPQSLPMYVGRLWSSTTAGVGWNAVVQLG